MSSPTPISLLGVDFTQTSTTPLFKLGTYVQCDNGDAFQYCRAAGTITQYDFVRITDSNYSVGALVTPDQAIPSGVGCSQVAAVLNDYLWVCRKGSFVGRLAGNCVLNVKLYMTGTAGVIDDSVVADALIAGVKAVSTVPTGSITPTSCLAAIDMWIGSKHV